LAHALLARVAEDPNDVLREIAQHELAAIRGTHGDSEAADAG
jgi:hypothetical protein